MEIKAYGSEGLKFNPDYSRPCSVGNRMPEQSDTVENVSEIIEVQKIQSQQEILDVEKNIIGLEIDLKNRTQYVPLELYKILDLQSYIVREKEKLKKMENLHSQLFPQQEQIAA